MDPSQTVQSKKTLFGHPVGLYVLFFTEMWERFSFYGMRVLLVLYMVDYLIPKTDQGFQVHGFAGLRSAIEGIFGQMTAQPLSSQIYGIYTSLVYLTPVLGGWMADKYFGQRKAVYIGGILMAIGHFLMALEPMFLVALVFLIFGNGFFKPSLSTQVGNLYPPGDQRRDSAFSIYYMGVNSGALLAPFICGTLGQKVGWHWGFGAAGVGMVCGLIFYMWGQKFLAQDQFHIAKTEKVDHAPLTREQWNAIIGLGVLCLVNIVFWAVYEQQGNTMQLFADRNTDWHVFGWEMPSTWFQSFNPGFIILGTIPLTMFWGWQRTRNKEPGSVIKMALGCIMLGASFLVLMYITTGLAPDQKVSFLWLIGCTFIYTLGEMYLSPIGLSLVTKVAPAKYITMLMGMWFLSSFFGNYLSGYIGTYYEKMSLPSFFLLLTVLGVVAGLVIFAMQKPLKKAVGHSV